MAKKIKLSIIVPVYNESKRLHKIHEILEFLKKKKYSSEVIVVDDGSRLDQSKILKKMRIMSHIKFIRYTKNRGKGFAIKKGMNSASGEIRMFTDLDLSVPIKTVDEFVKQIAKRDIVIGTRRKKGSVIAVHQNTLREMMGRVFTYVSRKSLSVEASDFTCGFKFFTNEASDMIFSNTKIDRWGFDSEILFLAKKFNFKIREIPVEWSNDQNSKVKFPDDIVSSILDLIKIRMNDFLKLYKK